MGLDLHGSVLDNLGHSDRCLASPQRQAAVVGHPMRTLGQRLHGPTLASMLQAHDFLQECRAGAHESLDLFALDTSVFWKRKLPANFDLTSSQGAAMPAPAKRHIRDHQVRARTGPSPTGLPSVAAVKKEGRGTQHTTQHHNSTTTHMVVGNLGGQGLLRLPQQREVVTLLWGCRGPAGLAAEMRRQGQHAGQW